MSVTAASTCSRFGSDVPLFCNNSACLASAWAGCVSAISCVLEAGALTPTLPLLPRDPISMVFPPNRTRREKSHPFPRRSYRQLTLAQQAEDRLRQLVGLGQHRSTRLLHDLVLGQVGRFRSVVGIHDTTAGSRGVLSNVLQVADGRLEAVLHGTEVGTSAVYRGDGIVKGLDGQLSVTGSQDIQSIDGMRTSTSLNHILRISRICRIAIKTKQRQPFRVNPRFRISITGIVLRVRYSTIFYSEILKRGQIDTYSTILSDNLGRSHASTSVIDLVNNFVNTITSFEIDFSTIQLDGRAPCQLALGVKLNSICIKASIIIRNSHLFTLSQRQGRSTTQPFGTHIANTEGQSFTSIGTDLEAFSLNRAIQQVLATEGSFLGDTSQLTGQVGELLVQRLTFFSRVGTVGGLQSQVTHTLHDFSRFLQSTFSSLSDGDTIVGVLDRHVQTIDLAGQTVGNLQTRRVILRAVDARTRRQTLQRGGQSVGRTTQVALSVQGSNVAVYCQGHGSSPFDQIDVCLSLRLMGQDSPRHP